MYGYSGSSPMAKTRAFSSAARMGTVEVYSCWNGDEEADPETRMDVALELRGHAFDLSLVCLSSI